MFVARLLKLSSAWKFPLHGPRNYVSWSWEMPCTHPSSCFRAKLLSSLKRAVFVSCGTVIEEYNCVKVLSIFLTTTEVMKLYRQTFLWRLCGTNVLVAFNTSLPNMASIQLLRRPSSRVDAVKGSIFGKEANFQYVYKSWSVITEMKTTKQSVALCSWFFFFFNISHQKHLYKLEKETSSGLSFNKEGKSWLNMYNFISSQV